MTKEKDNYETLYVDGEGFERMGEVFKRAFLGQDTLISKTRIGNANLMVTHQRILVDFTLQWIKANKTGLVIINIIL